jgi:hypothetical protein
VTDSDAGYNVTGVDISDDGGFVAVLTARTAFALPRPTVIGPRPEANPAVPQTEVEELWLVDLNQDTIEHASRSVDGSKPPAPAYNSAQQWAGASAPALADGARVLAWSSTSDRTAPYDANGFPDAVANFSSGGIAPPAASDGGTTQGAAMVETPALPAPLADLADWRLRVAARPTAKGLTVTVDGPARGTVRAAIRTRPPNGGAGAEASGAAGVTDDGGRVTLALEPRTAAQRAAALAAGAGTNATLTVAFSPAAGGAPLERTQDVSLPLPSGLRLTARAQRLAGGAVRVTVSAPAAGALSATTRLERGRALVASARRTALRRGALSLLLRPGRTGTARLRRAPGTKAVLSLAYAAVGAKRPAATRTIRLTLTKPTRSSR